MSVEAAAEAVRQSDAILVGAGAGMGADSGLPDFRGDEGFWNAYPPMRHLNIGFSEMADPKWFRQDPSLAWGFYGHRLQLYRDTAPHPGFDLLRRMAGDRPLSAGSRSWSSARAPLCPPCAASASVWRRRWARWCGSTPGSPSGREAPSSSRWVLRMPVRRFRTTSGPIDRGPAHRKGAPSTPPRSGRQRPGLVPWRGGLTP